MTSIPELMQTHLFGVFNERDRLKRQAAIARTYSDDVRWTDDDGVTTGRSALAAKAEALQQQLGDLQFIAAEPPYQTLGLGYLAFHVVEPGGDIPRVSGFDVAIVRDGVIDELYTVLTHQHA
ncbi:MAG: hypothetical protein QOH60_4281 [Mycobacterium sp.]|nr:hypothetical protein [Mycobacterium sp.]